jgi:dienelactone hydrolase
MFVHRCGIALALSLAVSLPAFAQPAPPAVVQPVAPAADTPLGSGPFPAVMVTDPSLPTHTIYRPANLAAVGGRVPVVVWGNGACANAGNSFRAFLTEIASYGYVVVALGPIQPNIPYLQAPTVPGPPRPPGGAPPRVLPPPATHTPQIIDAIDWLEKQAKGSGDLAGKIAVDRLAVMGQSCGGVQAIEASADPRVKTTVIWNSGMPPNGTDMAGGRPLTKADVLKLHAPTAYISGDQQDQAHPNADDDFERLSAIPVFRAWERGVPHGGTYRQPGGGEFAGVAVAWLNWQLKGDARAGRMFRGADCGLCANPRWVVRSKNIN